MSRYTKQDYNGEHEPMATKTITIHGDPGHSWGEVTLTDLLQLGIARDISSFSYYKPEITPEGSILVYLEEDCDLGRYIEAKARKGVKINFRYSTVDSDSHIRNYPRFNRVLEAIKHIEGIKI